jgi:arylsulfatase A-like enzyme
VFRVARIAAGFVVIPLLVFAGGLDQPNGTSTVRPAGESRTRTSQPNIVVILSDDERADNLWAMPNVGSDLVQHGVTFSNAFVVNSLCCPSRVSILTSQYSHTSGVYSNGGLYGGFDSFHGDSSTIATWLHGAGYQTALIGKYLNRYDRTYLPPGWDRWSAFEPAGRGGGSYYNYWLLDETGTHTYYGADPQDYSTDVLAGQADSFIRAADPSRPLFLFFTPFGPHAPYTPAPRHLTDFSHLPPYRPPSFNEADVSDKPAWVRRLPLLTQQQIKSLDSQQKNRYRTLLSVDDAVGEIVQALTDTGRLADTLIVFASDNGLEIGEHRFANKKVAWEESIRVPMIIRYDPLTGIPRVDSHLVLNVDIAPTAAELAGVPAPGAEGVSLVPLLTGNPPPDWRTDFLIEHLRDSENESPLDTKATVPTFCAVRTVQYLYVDYLDTGEEELYDLHVDPWELDSKQNDPGYGQVLSELRAREAELCSPPPP